MLSPWIHKMDSTHAHKSSSFPSLFEIRLMSYRGQLLLSSCLSFSILIIHNTVNFEIHLCSSDMKSDCIWRSISIQYVQIEPGVNSDLGNGSFWVEIRDAKHVDLITSRCTCRSTQVKIYTGLIASTDLSSQEMFTFFGNACAGRVGKQFRCLRLS